jgi:uncharacterized protein
MMTEDTKLFVLQPTSFCNLNCSYCYVPDRLNKKKMSLEIFEKAVKCLFADKKKGTVDFLYHAGEPMTVGKAFYEDALRIVDEYKPQDVEVTHVMQTNGVLVNEDWARFFAANNFKVGVSIDGPDFLHDMNRKNWAGKGSFKKSLEGFKLLKEYGIGTGILTVITAEHLNYPDELIEFYLENKMTDVAFNVEEIENDNKQSSLGKMENVEQDKYYNFMNRIFDLALKNADSIKIREVSDIIFLLYSRQKYSKYITEPLETRDLGIVTVQRNGDISTYCPEFAGMQSQEYNNFVIGNVLEIEKLSDVKNSKNYQKIKAAYDLRKEACKNECKYFPICGSAFLSNTYSESDSLTTKENIGCLLHKQRLTDVALIKLEKLSIEN